MRFKLDENLPVDLAGMLLAAGHDASSVYAQSLGGESDSRVIDVCRSEKRTFVTLDLDFSDIRTYPPGDYHGIIILRLAKQDKSNIFATMVRLLESAGIRKYRRPSIDRRRRPCSH